MPKYIMDGKNAPEFKALDSFTQGYIEAMFWTSEAPGVTTEEWQATEDHAEGSIPGDVGFLDITPATLEKIKADCTAFQKQCKALLAVASEHRELEYLGHDFWLDRSGHGTGFWDREELDFQPHPEHPGNLGKALSEAAKRFGEVDVYLGDDGKVYL